MKDANTNYIFVVYLPVIIFWILDGYFLSQERSFRALYNRVRKLDENIYKLLHIRAANHHVSMEEEARQIISQAVTAPEKITHVFQKYFGRKNGINLDIQAHRKPHEPMEFNEE